MSSILQCALTRRTPHAYQPRDRQEPTTTPQPILSPDPTYPRAELGRYGSGWVLVSLMVGEDGRIQQIRLDQATSADFAQAAVEAVRNWRFQPAKKDGISIPFLVQVDVEFPRF